VVKIALLVIVGLVSIRGLYVLGRILAIRIEKSVQDPVRIPRLKTLLQVGQSVAYILVALSAGLIILTLLGINIVPVLAGAGVVGLALSLGAQTLVKDFIGGVLILIENGFSLGDFIQVGEFSGVVEKITLRSTYLRNLDGRLNLVPNGEIRVISNYSVGWSVAIVDLKIPNNEKMDTVMQALEKAVERISEDVRYRSDLLETPQTRGWFGLGDWYVMVRLTAKTKPGRQLDLSAGLRQFSIEELQKQGIHLGIPLPAVNLPQEK
jgi:moderate conductance mechanosensitive channel